jgi:hypothetical protein
MICFLLQIGHFFTVVIVTQESRVDHENLSCYYDIEKYVYS